LLSCNESSERAACGRAKQDAMSPSKHSTSAHRVTQRDARRASKKAGATRRQVAAVPVRRRGGRLEVCLVTTRETKRWTVPKGWPMRGKKDHRAAEIEAEQDAGVFGQIHRTPLGEFQYWKRQETHFELVTVAAYRLDVIGGLQTWPERFERDLAWYGIDEAAELVQEPGLAAMLLSLERAD
jgi:ADP-ribose pyrophosphatase YjhB (NUDIX family)